VVDVIIFDAILMM